MKKSPAKSKSSELTTILAYTEEASRVQASLKRDAKKIVKLVDNLERVVRGGGTIYTCGNGGSNCDAMHLVEELVAVFKRARPGIRAQHFMDPSTMTCWSNDRGYDTLFERQVETFVTKKDAFIIFTSSGNSVNQLRALKAANKRGATTVALLGKGGGKAKGLAKLEIIVDASQTSHCQEAHVSILHLICELLETRLWPKAK